MYVEILFSPQSIGVILRRQNTETSHQLSRTPTKSEI